MIKKKKEVRFLRGNRTVIFSKQKLVLGILEMLFSKPMSIAGSRYYRVCFLL